VHAPARAFGDGSCSDRTRCRPGGSERHLAILSHVSERAQAITPGSSAAVRLGQATELPGVIAGFARSRQYIN